MTNANEMTFKQKTLTSNTCRLFCVEVPHIMNKAETKLVFTINEKLILWSTPCRGARNLEISVNPEQDNLSGASYSSGKCMSMVD